MSFNLRTGLFRLAACLALIALSLTGCSTSSAPNPKRMNLQISAGGRTGEMTIKVYVGVGNEYDKDIENDPVDSLITKFADTKPLSVISFDLTKQGKTIKRSDPLMKDWVRHGDTLVIIADLPRYFVNGVGTEKDPRRKNIPLDAKYWKGLKDKTLRVEIRETGVELLTPPAPVY